MIIIYTPTGGEPEEYDASTLRVSEVSIVQRTIDMKWAEIKEGLGEEDLDAMRGVAWVIKKRSQPSLRFGDFDPGVTEMVTRFDKQEIRDLVEGTIEAAAADPEVTRDQIAHALRKLPDAAHDPEYARRLIAERTAEDAPKEDPSLQAEATGPEPSPTPTSSAPDSSTSDSSPTSSTSRPQPSTS